MLQQLQPLSNGGSAAQHPPLLLIVNKCDLARHSSQPSGTAANGAAYTSALPAMAASANGAAGGSTSAAEVSADSPRASSADAFVPEAWRSAVSAVVHTSAKTGVGLDALKQAVLTLTDSPQLASGVLNAAQLALLLQNL